jgi:hypothetical protein
VTITNVKLSYSDHRFFANTDAQSFYLSGTISAAELEGDPKVAKPGWQTKLSLCEYQLNAVRVDGDGATPKPTDFSCTLALKPSAVPHLLLKYDLYVLPDNLDWMTKEMAFAMWSTTVDIDTAIEKITDGNAVPNVTVRESKGLDIDYTLSLSVARADSKLAAA